LVVVVVLLFRWKILVDASVAPTFLIDGCLMSDTHWRMLLH